MVRARPGSTLARWNSHDGMHRHTSADGGTRMCAGAGPGAGAPYFVTSTRQDRNESAPATRCSSTAGINASRTRDVRPSRRCGALRCAAAIVGSCGENPVASSSAASMDGSESANSAAPSPQASHSTTFGADLVIRAVTGPLATRLVLQIAPSEAITKHGSPRPRRNGASVTPGCADPLNVMLRLVLMNQS